MQLQSNNIKEIFQHWKDSNLITQIIKKTHHIWIRNEFYLTWFYQKQQQDQCDVNDFGILTVLFASLYYCQRLTNCIFSSGWCTKPYFLLMKPKLGSKPKGTPYKLNTYIASFTSLLVDMLLCNWIKKLHLDQVGFWGKGQLSIEFKCDIAGSLFGFHLDL